MAYEVIRKINATEFEIMPRKFAFRWSAARTAHRMNSAEIASKGAFGALAGMKMWYPESSRTVTALLESAREEIKRQEEQDAHYAAQQAAAGPRSTEELVKAIDAGLASEDKPRKPRATRKPRSETATGTRAKSARTAGQKADDVLGTITNVLENTVND